VQNLHPSKERERKEKREERKEEDTPAHAGGRAAAAAAPGASEITLPAARTSSRKTSASSAKAPKEKAAPKYDGEEQRYVRELVQALCDHLKIKGPKNLPTDGARERRAAHWFYANGPEQGIPADIATVIGFHRHMKSDRFWSRKFLSLENLEGPWTEHHGDLDSFTRATDETARETRTRNIRSWEGRRNGVAGTASRTPAGAQSDDSTDWGDIRSAWAQQSQERIAAGIAARDAALARGEKWDPREYERQQRERRQQQLEQGL
jgi:hypothetical protein